MSNFSICMYIHFSSFNIFIVPALSKINNPFQKCVLKLDTVIEFPNDIADYRISHRFLKRGQDFVYTA